MRRAYISSCSQTVSVSNICGMAIEAIASFHNYALFPYNWLDDSACRIHIGGRVFSSLKNPSAPGIGMSKHSLSGSIIDLIATFGPYKTYVPTYATPCATLRHPFSFLHRRLRPPGANTGNRGATVATLHRSQPVRLSPAVQHRTGPLLRRLHRCPDYGRFLRNL